MSDALYERYKEALRRGHVAARRGRQDAALAAYGEAARLAPDRPLPLVGIGNVLAGIGKHTEAVAAFDAALERAPADEAALRGRADVLIAAGDRVRAAETLDRLAAALDASGRASDALDAARHALELAESRSRRAGVKAMVARLSQSGTGDPRVSETLSRALGILEDRVLGRGRHERAEADAGRAEEPLTAGAVVEPVTAEPVTAERGTAQPEPATAAPVTAEPQTPVAPEDLPEAPAEAEEPAPPPFDPVASTAAIDDAAAAGDATTTRELALAAATHHRDAGQFSAAIDVCYLALATNPADPGLHLSLAELYLDLGWRAAAADKLILLARLAELGDDGETRARLCSVVSARLADDPRLVSLCA